MERIELEAIDRMADARYIQQMRDKRRKMILDLLDHDAVLIVRTGTILKDYHGTQDEVVNDHNATAVEERAWFFPEAEVLSI